MLLSLTVFSLNVAKFMPTTSYAVPLLGKLAVVALYCGVRVFMFTRCWMDVDMIVSASMLSINGIDGTVARISNPTIQPINANR